MAKKCLESAPGKGFWVTIICHSRSPLKACGDKLRGNDELYPLTLEKTLFSLSCFLVERNERVEPSQPNKPD
jgi:hypothetical protein